MARSGKYSINLSWYNLLGGIELFSFVAQKSYGYTIGKVTKAKRDVFNDWDNDFLDAEVEIDVLDIPANETIIVRSQDLTEQQITAIAQIKVSPVVNDVDQGLQVSIDRKSFNYRTDGDKRHEISFILTYPDLIIPTL